jgi:hypothetical protein
VLKSKILELVIYNVESELLAIRFFLFDRKFFEYQNVWIAAQKVFCQSDIRGRGVDGAS